MYKQMAGLRCKSVVYLMQLNTCPMGALDELEWVGHF